MIFDLIMLACVGAGIVCIGLLVYWCVEDHGGRDEL